MQEKFIGTSWKMNKTLREARDYLVELKAALEFPGWLKVFVVSPFTHLWELHGLVQDSPILLGAQNMHWAEAGPYTGEVSPTMLAEIGIDLVELGHSERRIYFNETDYTVNQKAQAAVQFGIIPLICIGEQKIEKDFGVAKEVIRRQLKIALHGIPASDRRRVWIAYEPVWAIGEGGVPAQPDYAGEMHSSIRDTLDKIYGAGGSDIPILYGGSVNAENAIDLVSQPEVDGLFIGRAAWQSSSFLEIIQRVTDFFKEGDGL